MATPPARRASLASPLYELGLYVKVILRRKWRRKERAEGAVPVQALIIVAVLGGIVVFCCGAVVGWVARGWLEE
jgi:hypothetical protein